ncbi:MAG: DEAD/DEAH box helicase [Candidatus Aminicenantes bacterium]|nr:DEAD/DEAH box helicase [Candidatus Aminicenantes bacterium]
MNFIELNLKSDLLRGIADRGYEEMTGVQEKTLPIALQGDDVAVQSQTGTGKTAAFLITLFERLHSSSNPNGKKALIMVPTRELAVQIEKEAHSLNRYLRYSIGSFYGGVGYSKQLALLKKGLDIIIGTPGRLLDLSTQGHMNLKEIKILVIDEADRLFDMGFLPDIKKLLHQMPSRNHRHTMLFSATLNRSSQRIIAEHLNQPTSIAVTPEKLTVDTIIQEIYHVKSHVKLNLMLGILKAQSPRNALIFTNMKHHAFKLSKKLQLNGFSSQHLTGDLPQNRRLKVIDDFMAGKFSFLVATDVAARGLQIDNLEMVINYDLPQDSENYVHRIGRTARAGNSGKAISLASENTANHLEAIESFIGMKIPVFETDFDLFATDLSEGFRFENRYRKTGPIRSRANFGSKRPPQRNGTRPNKKRSFRESSARLHVS